MRRIIVLEHLSFILALEKFSSYQREARREVNYTKNQKFLFKSFCSLKKTLWDLIFGSQRQANRK